MCLPVLESRLHAPAGILCISRCLYARERIVWFLSERIRETLQLLAQPFGFGGVVVLDGVLQKRVQPLDLVRASALYRAEVSVRMRSNTVLRKRPRHVAQQDLRLPTLMQREWWYRRGTLWNL